jgi:hypothetical protein
MFSLLGHKVRRGVNLTDQSALTTRDVGLDTAVSLGSRFRSPEPHACSGMYRTELLGGLTKEAPGEWLMPAYQGLHGAGPSVKPVRGTQGPAAPQAYSSELALKLRRKLTVNAPCAPVDSSAEAINHRGNKPPERRLTGWVKSRWRRTSK